MFNLNINWPKIIKENLPFFLHRTKRIDFIKALISGVNQIYQEFLVMYQVYVYKIRFNGQVIYLEKILNDKFSPTSGGIYIVDANTIPKNYLYRKSELKPPIYLYRKWKSTTNYSIGQFAVEGNNVFKSLTNNINSLPSTNPTDWQYHSDVVYLRRASEFYMQYDFIVRVPSTVTFNVVSLKAIVDYYRLAGKRYKIEIY